MKEIRGGCVCGAVQYSVADDFTYPGYCDCPQCSTLPGVGVSSVAVIAGDALGVIAGEECIGTFQKNANSILSFCKVCGTNLYAHKVQTGLVNIRLCRLSEVPSFRSMGHVFVESKAPWYEITACSQE